MSATEKVFSRRVTETRDGRKGQRIYTQVPWDTRDDDVPQMDEAFPDDSDLRVVSREFRPIKVDGDDYDYCEALIQYSTKERLRIKEWWELASEGTTQPETLTWQSDSTEEEVRVPRLVVEGVYCRQVYRTYNPISMLAEAVGKVNDATFGKFPAGTLLYLGPDIRVIYTESNRKEYSIIHRCQYRRQGWNYVYRPSTGKYERFTTDLYESTGFGRLL